MTLYRQLFGCMSMDSIDADLTFFPKLMRCILFHFVLILLLGRGKIKLECICQTHNSHAMFFLCSACLIITINSFNISSLVVHDVLRRHILSCRFVNELVDSFAIQDIVDPNRYVSLKSLVKSNHKLQIKDQPFLSQAFPGRIKSF